MGSSWRHRMTKVLSILLVFCIVIVVESSHGHAVKGKEKETEDFWKRGRNFRHRSRMRPSSRGWRKKPSRMNGGFQGGARRLNPKPTPVSGRPRKMRRTGRKMVSLSTIEDLIKAIGRRVDQTGNLVEEIAIKEGIPIPSKLNSTSPAPAVPSK